MIKLLVNFLKNQNTWGLLIGKHPSDLKKINQPFWIGRADPFLLSNEGILYVLFEQINIISRKGKICIGEIYEYKIKNIKTLLSSKKHLSFPFIFRDKKNNKIYMIPESHKTRSVDLYEFNKTNLTVNKVKTILNNVECVDTVIYYYNSLYWLFTTQRSKNENFNDLYIYFSEDLINKEFKPHYNNPVLQNTETSRNAGPIFEENGLIYRVSQNCKISYGKNISLTKILKLNENEFKESKPQKILFNNINEFYHTYGKLGKTIVSDFKFRIKNPLLLFILVFKRFFIRLFT